MSKEKKKKIRKGKTASFHVYIHNVFAKFKIDGIAIYVDYVTPGVYIAQLDHTPSP